MSTTTKIEGSARHNFSATEIDGKIQTLHSVSLLDVNGRYMTMHSFSMLPGNIMVDSKGRPMEGW